MTYRNLDKNYKENSEICNLQLREYMSKGG